MTVTYLQADPDHVPDIAARLRRADCLEAAASGHPDPAEAMLFSLEHSRLALTALFDGRPEIMFGVGDLNILTRTGAPWLLGTDAGERRFRLFARHSRHWFGQLARRYDCLRNAVDDRNILSRRWLEWLGFRLSEPLPIGVNGEPFRVFEWRRQCAQ